MSDATFYGRLAVGGIIIAWMQWGPIAHQALGQRVGWGMMTWRMYYGAARDVCDVRYFAVDADGSRTPVDRFDALGYEHFWNAKRNVRRISDRKHIERQGRQICREFLPAGMQLEADARCASYKGWKPETFDGPICLGSGREGRQKPARGQQQRRRHGGEQ